MKARTRVTKQERSVMSKVRRKEFSIQQAMKKLGITNHGTFYTVYFHCTQADVN